MEAVASPRSAALFVLVALGALALPPASAAEDATPLAGDRPTSAAPRPRIGRIEIERHDVFPQAEKDWPPVTLEGLVFTVANGLHSTTRREVIRRELLFDEGDPYDPELVAETERNLRRLGFIGEAAITPIPQPDGTVDLLVRTHDKFTLRAGVDGSFFGGKVGGAVRLGETNLFGYGKELRINAKAREDKRQLELKYEDPRLLGTRLALKVKLGVSDEGETYGVFLGQPFYSLETDEAYSAAAQYQRSDQEFFEAGSEVARVERTSLGFGVNYARAFGDRVTRPRLGVAVNAGQDRFGKAKGTGAAAVEVPIGFSRYSLELQPGLDCVPAWLKLTFYDALGRTEDVGLGLRAAAGLAIAYRDGGPDDGLEWPLGLSLQAAFQPADGTLSVLSFSGSERFDRAGRLTSWGASSFWHQYFQVGPQTFALNAAFDAAFEGIDLPAQLSLGEDNGLRGYPPHEFVGTRRFRVNFEDRIVTPIELFSVRLGVVAFFDIGYAWDDGDPFRPRKSVGIGFRAGSAHLFGGNVVRLDVAYALDDDARGRFRGISVSASSEQVFKLFSNPERLADDF